MGVTLAIFSSAGTMPVEKEELMIAEINSAAGSRVDLATKGSIIYIIGARGSTVLCKPC